MYDLPMELLEQAADLRKQGTADQFKSVEVKTKMRTVTGNSAGRLLQRTNTYAGQRDLIKIRLAYFCLALMQGLIRPGSTIAFFVHKGKKALINGQHLLHAIWMMGAKVRFNFVEYVYTGSRPEMLIRRLFETFDPPGGHRRPIDYMRAAGMLLTTRFSAAQLKAIFTAGKQIAYSFSATDERLLRYCLPLQLEVAMRYQDAAAKYFKLVNQLPANNSAGPRRATMTTHQVLAPMLVMLRYKPRKAMQFLRSVLFPKTVTFRDPAILLREHLAQKEPAALYENWSYRMHRRIVADCWNHFLAGKAMEGIFTNNYSDPDQILEIHGTPFVGGKRPELSDKTLKIYAALSTIDQLKQIGKNRGEDYAAESTRTFRKEQRKMRKEESKA